MRRKMNVGRVVTTGLVVSAMAAAGAALARPPFSDAELDIQMNALYGSAQLGYDLWHGSKPSMTTNGLACGNCHPDTAKARRCSSLPRTTCCRSCCTGSGARDRGTT